MLDPTEIDRRLQHAALPWRASEAKAYVLNAAGMEVARFSDRGARDLVVEVVNGMAELMGLIGALEADAENAVALAQAAMVLQSDKNALISERDDARRQLADKDGEFAALRRFEAGPDGAQMDVTGLAPKVFGAFLKLHLDTIGADNYAETRCDVTLANGVGSFVFTVQRAEKLTPHQFRQKAESERDSARAIARVLAHAYESDNRPPQNMVRESLAFPVTP
jgi:hypothetical protein